MPMRCSPGLPALLVVLVAGCGASRSSGPEFTLEHDGQTRRYIVHTPPGMEGNGPHATVLVLHGGGNADDDYRRIGSYTSFDDKADRDHFLTVYPATLWDQWNDGRDAPLLREQREQIDDVGFFRALMDALVAQHGADPARIYATGISNGGFMSHRLGCELADRIVAVAPVAAGMAAPLAPRCQPSRTVPVLLIHGTRDGFVPFNGGTVSAPLTRQDRGQTLSSDDSRRKWAELNGCSQGVTTTSQNKNHLDGTTADRVDQDGCPSGGTVIQWVIRGGGHTWPGANWIPVVGPVSREFNAEDVIWDFFRNRMLP